MRIEILIEDGRPLLVFPDEIQRDKTVTVYGREGHSTASRGYLRKLAQPTAVQMESVWSELACYAQGQRNMCRKT